MAFANANNIAELLSLLSGDTKDIVQQLQELNLLRQCGKCPKCRKKKTLIRHKGAYVQRCKTCKSGVRSIATDTFFSQVRFAFKSIIILAFVWSANISVGSAHNLLGYRKDVISKYYRYFRDICSWKLLKHDFEIGGEGHIVQIDESVITKRKYNKGRRVAEQWVLGIVDTSTNVGLVRYVPRRDANTLIPIITSVVKQGSEIWTDEWKPYRALATRGYVHKTVCHKREFKGPDGTCTNVVEGFWAVLKKFLRQNHVLKSKLLPEHIDEFMWRRVFCPEAKTGDIFRILLSHIAERYPC